MQTENKAPAPHHTTHNTQQTQTPTVKEITNVVKSRKKAGLVISNAANIPRWVLDNPDNLPGFFVVFLFLFLQAKLVRFCNFL